MRRAVLKEAVKRFPWLANVTLYGCLFAGGDLAHQLIAQKERLDWTHTRNVAIVATSFHGNFNYFWLRALERRFPGRSVGMVSRKLLLDQSFASPLATSVFYTGKSSHAARDSVCVRVCYNEQKKKKKPRVPHVCGTAPVKSGFCLFCFSTPFSRAGVSFLEDKEDVFEDWREKFFNTWKVSMETPAALTD